MGAEPVRLTAMTSAAGWAAKRGPEALAQVLRPLLSLFPAERFPNLLVGLAKADDAAVYRLTDDIAVIETVDFFTPVVDDPYDFGAIAAANAMSDVYAMGGEVLFGLNIAAFPADMDPDIIAAIIRGGAEKLAEAGGVLAGGHTLDDKEPKFGMAVTGIVHPSKVLTKAGARPGDALVLTKPLGVGIITTANKAGVAQAAHLAAATATMAALNRRAAQAMHAVGVNAATDITGFAILGHASEMAALSGVGLRLRLADIPFLDGAKGYAAAWLFPGGANRNQDYFGCGVDFDPAIPDWMQLLLFTPETSGGLLVAVPSAKLDALRVQLAATGQPYWVIGEVVAGERIVVEA